MAQSDADATEALPEVSKVENGELIATAYFENGAKLRYKQTREGFVEEVFAPSDPDSVMEKAVVTTHPDTAENLLAESLDVYRGYDTVEELRRDWTNLAEWITHE